jgi:hypothetical protein
MKGTWSALQSLSMVRQLKDCIVPLHIGSLSSVSNDNTKTEKARTVFPCSLYTIIHNR